jgi:hypothetical protein
MVAQLAITKTLVRDWSRSRQDHLLDVTCSRSLTRGIIKQHSSSRDIKDRSQSDATRAMQTV